MMYESSNYRIPLDSAAKEGTQTHEGNGNPAEGAVSGAATSGADPISAIANAVSSIVTAGLQFAGIKQQRELNYELWLRENTAQFKWFFKYDKEKDNTNLIIIAILSVIAVAMMVAVSTKK